MVTDQVQERQQEVQDAEDDVAGNTQMFDEVCANYFVAHHNLHNFLHAADEQGAHLTMTSTRGFVSLPLGLIIMISTCRTSPTRR